MAHPSPLRFLTIDVEEYFHIEAARDRVSRESWETWPSRVERNLDLLLSLFDRHGRKGTFFVLGWVAQRHPSLAARIAAAGHEVASHGSFHDRLHRLNPTTFRSDLADSLALLQDQTGQKVIGYRAPTFSLVPQTAWAIDVMADLGIEYDASIFPVRHPWYGVPTAPDRPFFVRGPGGATLLELPPLTWRLGGRNLPVAGGGYFRLLPLTGMRRGLAQAAKQDRPAVLYFHPWEFDPGMPRMPLSPTGRVRTYTGLANAERRLDSIAALGGEWKTLREALPQLRAMAERREVLELTAGAR